MGVGRRLTIALNATAARYLPIIHAHDCGAFRAAGLDVALETYVTSVTVQQPRIARGEVDIGAVSPNPELFELFTESPTFRIIASVGIPRPGRSDAAWLNVAADSPDIVEPADARGRVIEAGRPGGATDFLVGELLRQARLDPGRDVALRRDAANPQEMMDAFAAGAEVVGLPEPFATMSEQGGASRRWMGFVEVAPWHQVGLLAASARALAERPEVVRAFLDVYLATCRELNARGGRWTEELLESAARWGGAGETLLRAQGGLPYWDEAGAVWAEGLRRTQDLWVSAGLLGAPVVVDELLAREPATARFRAS